MATKNYYLQFANGDPRAYTGLTPTMVIWWNQAGGTTASGPSVSEIYAGAGIYTFAWAATTPIAFLCDGFTTGLTTTLRYVSGSLDPSDQIDQYGTTLVALGNTGLAFGESTFQVANILINYGTTLTAIGTTGVALGTSGIALGTTNVAIGTSLTAIGTTLIAGVSGLGNTLGALGATILAEVIGLSGLFGGIGTIGSTFGGEFTDPIDLFGYLKRTIENLEGDQSFLKASGSLSIYSRGSSTLLRVKSVANTSTTVTKTGL